MIQFNLLPDVKIEYKRTQRIKRAVVVIATLFISLSLFTLAVLFTSVNYLQKQHIKNLTNDISIVVEDIKKIPDLDKMLTVQNQLSTITELHDNKPVASRIINYLGQLITSDLTIAKLDIDFNENSMAFTGAASSLDTINKFIDTLKFTQLQNDEINEKAFSGVVLESFGRDDRGASYQVNLLFDPVIFSSDTSVKLIVPEITTTRSSALFFPLSDSRNIQSDINEAEDQ